MELCHYSDVLQITARLCGLVFPCDGEVEKTLRPLVQRHLGNLWVLAEWPDLKRSEQREYRRTYSSLVTYAAGDEVYFPPTDKYYQALDTALNQPPAVLTGGEYVITAAFWAECRTGITADNWVDSITYVLGDVVRNPADGAYYQCRTASSLAVEPPNIIYWGLITPFDPYVSRTQAGETVIGEPLRVTDINPRTSTRLRDYDFELTERGVQVIAGPNRPWITFKIVPPVLTGEVLDLTAAYAVGRQVQFDASTAGDSTAVDFYDCATITTAGQTPATHASKWTRVELPLLFRDYVAAKAAADFLTGESDDRSAAAANAAAEALTVLTDRLYRSERQVKRTQVRTY